MKPVRINYNVPPKVMETTLKSCDALIWPGGAIESPNYTLKQYEDYMLTLENTYKTVLDLNDGGRRYPLWATCLGFEVLYVFETVHHVKFNKVFTYARYHAYEGLSELKFNQEPSVLKDWFKDHGVLEEMATTKCVHHHHKLGFDPSGIKKDIRVTSNDVDHLGQPFVNSFEMKHYPIFGVQYHPEQPEDAYSQKISKLFIEFLKSQT
jgi:anthranilate/para-aminobenzoate synthase component II